MHYFHQILLLLILLSIHIIPMYAQERASPTPIVVILRTPTPFVEQPVITSTPTFTPTPEGVVLLDVRPEAGNINVRTEPGPEADLLGNITSGTLYPVYRRFFNWYEIQFDLAPNGRGWIYGDLVEIVGDENGIEVIEGFDWATPQGFLNNDSSIEELSEEDLLSVTPSDRIIEIPSPTANVAVNANETPFGENPLPTFTYPPGAAQVPTQSAVVPRENTGTSTDNLPPLLSIVLLGGMGVIGLLLNSLRG